MEEFLRLGSKVLSRFLSGNFKFDKSKVNTTFKNISDRLEADLTEINSVPEIKDNNGLVLRFEATVQDLKKAITDMLSINIIDEPSASVLINRLNEVVRIQEKEFNYHQFQEDMRLYIAGLMSKVGRFLLDATEDEKPINRDKAYWR